MPHHVCPGEFVAPKEQQQQNRQTESQFDGGCTMPCMGAVRDILGTGTDSHGVAR
jgi:hypothetical protein